MRIHNLTLPEIERRVGTWLTSVGQHTIVTPNPEMLVAANRDEAFRRVLNGASLSIADGVGVAIASWILGQPLRLRCPGVEVAETLLRLSAQHHAKIFLLGGRPGVAQRAAKRLRQKLPRLEIVGATDGGAISDPVAAFEELIECIRCAQPNVLIVGFGHGKQERFIAAHIEKMPTVRVAIGVGGTLDFWSGRIRRAPWTVRRLGLEWFYRFIRQPSRVRRIARATFVFPYLVLTTQFFHRHDRN